MERENAEFKKFHPSQLLDFMYRTFIIDSFKEEGLKLLILRAYFIDELFKRIQFKENNQLIELTKGKIKI
jgi:hypothetical protein